MNKPRLIDANEAKKLIRGIDSEFAKFVDEIPTAYDIDKVVKKLESNSWKSPKEPHKLMWLDRAIEIVKGGAECIVEVNKTSEGGAE